MWILNPTPATVDDIKVAASKLAAYATMHVLVHRTEVMDVKRGFFSSAQSFLHYRVWLYQPTGTNVNDRVLAIQRIA